MSFSQTNLSGEKEVDGVTQVSKHEEQHDALPHKKRIRKMPSKNTMSEVKQPADQADIQITTKRIVGDKHHVYIRMVGTGKVRVELVMKKMDELQDIMNNIDTKPCLQFTFVFDFRNLRDFTDYSTIRQFGGFMLRNKGLFERRLRKSYLLLRYWTWRATVRLLFAAFRPTKPVEYEIEENIDRALCA